MSFNSLNRRDFLRFLGRSGVAISLGSSISGCASKWGQSTKPFTPVAPSDRDELLLAEGFSFKKVISWGDVINPNKEIFGFNCDYLALVPAPKDQYYLWVNHESPHPIFVSGYEFGGPRTKEQVDLERKSVGGSIVKIRCADDGSWQWSSQDTENRRIDGFTPFPFANGETIAGKKIAIGTLANCAGGVTPWGHILTCEENYYKFYGENEFDGKSVKFESGKKHLGWDRFYQMPPEHYGWVVEINPKTGTGVKHTSLGRYAHECATVTKAKDGRIVVYSGDDKNDECIYKFISESTTSLNKGKLYAADTIRGRWLPLNLADTPMLKKYYKNDLDILIHTRFAAHTLGATPLDRPEDIEIDPKSGHVFATLTNNVRRGNYFGSILKIQEKDGDAGSTEFVAETFLAGGESTGFAAPDNLVFDSHGDLWMTTDIGGDEIKKGPYKNFKSNGLFYIPLSGPAAGKAWQVATAPVDAELTGPCFSPDGKTLFLSVQHPGEESRSLKQLTSHWPDGGDAIPKSTVVAITSQFFTRSQNHHPHRS